MGIHKMRTEFWCRKLLKQLHVTRKTWQDSIEAYNIETASRNSSVCTWTRLRVGKLEESCFDIRQSVQNAQIGSGAHPSFLFNGYGCLYPEGKAAVQETNRLLSSNAKVNNEWRYNSAPPYVFMACTNTTSAFLPYLQKYVLRMGLVQIHAKWQVLPLAALDYHVCCHKVTHTRQFHNYLR